jgi:hypothetical protein
MLKTSAQIADAVLEKVAFRYLFQTPQRMIEDWLSSAQLMRKVAPKFNVTYGNETMPGLHSVAYPRKRKIGYGWLVNMGFKDPKQTAIHEMAHMLPYEKNLKKLTPEVLEAFPGYANTQNYNKEYSTLRKFLPLRFSKAVTHYGASHPIEDLTETIRLALQNKDIKFRPGTPQHQKATAVRSWLGLPPLGGPA